MSGSFAARLQEKLAELLRSNDHEGARRLTDLLVALVSADELTAAMFREDETAMAFHADVLSRNIETSRAIEFHVEDGSR